MDKNLFLLGLILFSLFLSGCLLDEKGKLSVSISDSDDEKLEGAEILVKSQGTDITVAEGITDSEGKWEIEITEGDYTIEIFKEGYGNTYLKDRTIGPNGLIISWTLSIEDDIVSEESIEEILAKAENIDSMEYTLTIITDPTNAFAEEPAHFYVKGKKYRSESSLQTEKAYVFDGEYEYLYSEGGYFKSSKEKSFYANSMFDLKYVLEQSLDDVSMKEIGKETINGMKSRIIEFDLKSTDNRIAKTKAWISEEYGIPTKIATEMDFGGTTKVFAFEVTDIKLNSVDDSFFEVPEELITN